MARSPLSPRAAALAVALLLLCAAGARAAAGEGKAISDRGEGRAAARPPPRASPPLEGSRGGCRSRPPPAARRPPPAEGKQILAIFAEHRGLLRVMRRAISAVEKNNKKTHGKRGLLEEGDGEQVTLIVKLGTRAPTLPLPSNLPAAGALSATLGRPLLLLCPCPLSHRRPPPPLTFRGGRCGN
jgi:hypothetical protein